MLPTLSIPRSGVRRGTDWTSDMDRFFDEFFRTPRMSTWSAWTPPADLYETGDEFVLEMEMPGFHKDDLQVTVERGILTVSGQRREQEREENVTYHVRERSYDRFSRSFSLPQSVNADDVDAEYDNGILRVRLPKLSEAKPRQIAVKSS